MRIRGALPDARPDRVRGGRGAISDTSTVPNNELFADGLLTVREAYTFLRCSSSTFYELMATNAVPWTRVGGRRKIPKRALVDLAAAGLVRARER